MGSPPAPSLSAALTTGSGDLFTGRCYRRLAIWTLALTLPGALITTLVASLLALRLSAVEAGRDGTVEQHQLLQALNPRQPLVDLRHRLHLSTEAGEARMLLLLNRRQQVVVASETSLEGRILGPGGGSGQPALLAPTLRALERSCGRQVDGACLAAPHQLFLGPLPLFGGHTLVQVQPWRLTLEPGEVEPQPYSLVATIDLAPYRRSLLQLLGSTLLLGLVPMLACSVGLVGLLRQRLLPELLGQARTDALTGMFNRRAFLELAAARLHRGATEGQELAMAVLDLDHFKAINDTYGHGAGDALIRRVSEGLQQGVRRGVDLVGRLGGDEFALLLQASGPEAAELLERCRRVLAEQPLAWMEGESEPVAIALSAGVASTCGPAGYDLRSLLLAADQALYRAKRQGRSQVVLEM